MEHISSIGQYTHYVLSRHAKNTYDPAGEVEVALDSVGPSNKT